MKNDAITQFARVGSAARQLKQSEPMECDWKELRSQLLLQWPQLTPEELDKAGPNSCRLARLIESKYGISYALVENYLRNFERTIPMAASG